MYILFFVLKEKKEILTSKILPFIIIVIVYYSKASIVSSLYLYRGDND